MRFFYAVLLILTFPMLARAEEASVYKFDDLKFSIECPQSYEAKKMAGAYENTVGIILSRDTDKKSFKPNVTISSAPNSSPPIDLDQFFNLNLQNFLKDVNFRVVLAEKTKLGDKEAYQLLYRQKAALKESGNAVVPIKVLQVYVIEPSRVYVMNYSAAEEDFDGYLASANGILKSFKTR